MPADLTQTQPTAPAATADSAAPVNPYGLGPLPQPSLNSGKELEVSPEPYALKPSPVLTQPTATQPSSANLSSQQDDANANASHKLAPDATQGAGLLSTQTANQDNTAEEQAQAEAPTDDPDSLPVTDFANFDFGMAEEARKQIDPDMMRSFGKLAESSGLTGKQVKDLVAWQMDYMSACRERQLDEGGKALRESWGAKTQANVDAINKMNVSVDQALGIDFSGALARSGAAYDVDVVKGLAYLASMLSEGRVGVINGAGGRRAQTALEGLEEAYARAQAGWAGKR